MDWEQTGKYYGYPKCCIDAFANNFDSITDDQKIAGKGTGFIPCPQHTEMILDGKIKLEDLIKNRAHKHPFPFDTVDVPKTTVTMENTITQDKAKIAEKIAEYLSLALSLKYDKDNPILTSPPEHYRRANQLIWELAMILPEDIYTEIAIALLSPSRKINMDTAILLARNFILGADAGELKPDQIIKHAPGIGEKK